MKLSKTAVLVALLTMSMAAQEKKHNIEPKPISDYMRQVGLMYMEEIDSL